MAGDGDLELLDHVGRKWRGVADHDRILAVPAPSDGGVEAAVAQLCPTLIGDVDQGKDCVADRDRPEIAPGAPFVTLGSDRPRAAGEGRRAGEHDAGHTPIGVAGNRLTSRRST